MDELTAYQFLSRLPFLFKDLPSKAYQFLVYKWGGVDTEWHSIKNAIKHTDIGITIEEARKLEGEAIEKIEDTIAEIFTCKNCNNDLRKCGLNMHETGYQTCNAFLSEDGKIARTTNERFLNNNFENVQRRLYSCLHCGQDIKEDTEVYHFIKNGLNSESVRAYMKKFKGVEEEIPTTKAEKKLNREIAMDNIYAFRPRPMSMSRPSVVFPDFDEITGDE